MKEGRQGMTKVRRIGKHPIFTFLRDELKMNLSEFSVVTGIPQSTVSTWIERERTIETLPMYFFVGLANLGNLSLDQVYNALIVLESEYVINQVENKTYLAAEGIALTDKVENEARLLKSEFEGKAKELGVPGIVKKLKVATREAKKDVFMSEIIGMYALIGRILPVWIGMIFDEDEDIFVEISLIYVRVLSELS